MNIIEKVDKTNQPTNFLKRDVLKHVQSNNFVVSPINLFLLQYPLQKNKALKMNICIFGFSHSQ